MARTKGTKQLGVEMSEGLFDEFKAFCAARGETVRHHLELAIRRHMNTPPPPPQRVETPPLPPVTVPPPAGEAARPPKAARKSKRKA